MSIDDLTRSGQQHSSIWKLEHSVTMKEDLTQKLRKFADLVQKGLLTDLLSKMWSATNTEAV
jgi:hypothetical protein